MLKFIWNSWWRNKERFILLLVGVLIVSTGLSYLIGTTQANNGTVVDELQKRWKSSYDIVVRPPGSRSVTEDLKLLEPNYMSGLDGGITMQQYQTIQEMADVEVAAPIAMIGNSSTGGNLGTHTFENEGIYKLTITDRQDTGLNVEQYSSATYIAAGWEPSGDATNAGVTPMPLGKQPLYEFGSSTMLAGIDPKAEAQLIGLDQATFADTYSRYFTKDDRPSVVDEVGTVAIPVLLNEREYVDASRIYTYEKLDVPLLNDSMNETIQDVTERGGKKYLETLPVTSDKAKKYTVTTQQIQKKLVQDILSHAPAVTDVSQSNWMALKPSPITYQPIKSPYASRWPFTYQVEPKKVNPDSLLFKRTMYREAREFGSSSADWKRLRLDYIGVFNPKKLNVSKDPLTELPMETYFPAKAQWVMNAKEQPVNPVRDVKPSNDSYDFLTKPPSMLTTLEAAFQIRGKKAISVIRVNVKGVDAMNEQSEAKLQAVAQEIEDKTGLITDVTLGSSPQPALTYLPGLEKQAALGWVQQPWIKLGSSISIFQEAKVGMSGVIASVIAVALVYVFSSNIILLYARKKEFAILLSLGWRPSQLSKMLYLEATLLGTLVALIAWSILGTFWLTTDHPIALTRILWIGLAGLFIYWGGTLVPMALIRRIQPYDSMRSGEVSKGRRFVRSQSVFGMSLNQLVTYWQRTLLSIVAIALPTSLFIFFLFVTFRLKGVLYASWLGEFVALEVGTMHYIAMAVALLIAILTTTEILWQNVNERKSQLAVLKATGWQDRMIRRLVLLEGLLTGLFAGIAGLIMALFLILKMYNQFPSAELGFLSLTLLIPVATGVTGALLPAQRAVRITPNAAIGSVAVNSKATERRFRIAFGTIGGALVAGVASLFLFATNETEPQPVATQATETPVVTTTGSKIKDGLTGVKRDEPTASKSSDSDAIKKLMAKGSVRTFPGDPALKTTYFWVGPLLKEPPASLKLEEKAGYRYITVPVYLKTVGSPDESTYYFPNRFQMFDTKNKHYVPVDYVNRNDAWQRGMDYTVNKRSHVDLVYQVPEDETEFVLIASGAAISKSRAVKIEVNPPPKALTDKEEQAVKQMMNKGVVKTYPGDPLQKKAVFHVDAMLPNPPKELKLKPRSGYQLVTLPLIFQDTYYDYDGSSVNYRPNTFTLQAPDGTEYEQIDYVNRNEKAWKNGFQYYPPFRSQIDFVYEVPDDQSVFVMYASSEAFPKPTTVKIELD
ncbi:ABC transporter permease [Exiguobacterium sp. K1]|uniref:ABC transporter permease n=1 Tax=Exiguobacterium sp. K1 TaxID=2980105 RepID=UPI00299DDC42|nr:ABC transporter permease [Exiguobacterium sp. K1]MDX1258968.1 ABC transporter permease [Exiguobacterium sp. K1]